MREPAVSAEAALAGLAEEDARGGGDLAIVAITGASIFFPLFAPALAQARRDLLGVRIQKSLLVGKALLSRDKAASSIVQPRCCADLRALIRAIEDDKGGLEVLAPAELRFEDRHEQVLTWGRRQAHEHVVPLV